MNYRKKSIIFILFLLLILSIIGFAGNVRQPVSVTPPNVKNKYDELEVLLKKIRTERELYYSINKKYQQDLNDIETKINDVKNEIKLLTNLTSKQDLTNKNLQKKIDILRKKLRQKDKYNENYMPVFLSVLDSLEYIISHSMPYKVQERLRELNSVKVYTKTSKNTIQDKFKKIWNLCAKELKLSKKNIIFETEIQLADKSLMVNVLKIGSMGMYFMTYDNTKYGILKKDDKDKYQWQFTENKEVIKNVKKAFAIINKQNLPELIYLPVENNFEK